ncbi:MAG TPA: apolipoprotein N-acyltransferase [Tenuifilaceae bacterium]|nr:apolipoprotein N-acyltransferase [Tenuifilaceae bacterium]
MRKFYNPNFCRVFFSGILLALPWYEGLPSYSIFFGFVPLLLAYDKLNEKGAGFWKLMLYAFIAFFTWNALSTWWIYKATMLGAILAVLITTMLMTLVFAGYHFVRKYAGKVAGIFGFITLWIAYERFFHDSEVAWPWLSLGNSLGNHPKVIQWYEFTGMMGGSLWILVINFLILGLVHAIRGKQIRRAGWFSIAAILTVILPLWISISMYNRYHEVQNPVRVVIVQPSIDPYNEKFSGLTNEQQLDIMFSLAKQAADSTTDYVVCPETAIDDRIWEHELHVNSSILRIKQFVDSLPNVKWVTGAITLKLFSSSENLPPTARELPYREGYFYDRYNSAIQVDTAFQLPIYHKSKLVVGVEMMPYPKQLKFLEKLAIDLGGISGSLGTQPDRGVLWSPDRRFGVGPIICYESDFGEFVSGYVKNGANLLFVITNDGWWGDTPGYKQHLSFSRIRAIETRRSVARSANTGISAIINQRGDLVRTLGWWERGTISGTINANSKQTWYVREGDYIGRLSAFMAVLTLAAALAAYLMKNNGRSAKRS